jgi:hypothetical protein
VDQVEVMITAFAMAFSFAVEMLNLRLRERCAAAVQLRKPKRKCPINPTCPPAAPAAMLHAGNQRSGRWTRGYDLN